MKTVKKMLIIFLCGAFIASSMPVKAGYDSSYFTNIMQHLDYRNALRN